MRRIHTGFVKSPTTNNHQQTTQYKEWMRTKKYYRYVMYAVFTVCFSFCAQMVFCQTVQTITDKTDILIGEQIKLKIRAEVPLNNAAVNKWLVIPDSIAHFEIVEAAKPDTISFKDNSQTIEQTITITSFDSGSPRRPRPDDRSR